MIGVLFSGLIGLLIGGVVGGYSITFLHQLRTGRAKLSVINLGPIKIDLTGLNPKIEEDGDEAADWSAMAPFIEGSGTTVAGCLSVMGAALVLIGFVLPWASFSFSFLASGRFSGLSMFLQLVSSIFLALLGSLGLGSLLGDFGFGLAGLGMILAFILFVVLVFLLIVPVMGYRIGKMGLNLVQSLQLPKHESAIVSKQLIRWASLGLIPSLCFLTTATTGVSNLASIGFSAEAVGGSTGLWFSLGGFAIAIVAGLVISTSAGIAERLVDGTPSNVPARSHQSPRIPAPAVSEEEQMVLRLLDEGFSANEIPERLGVAEGWANSLVAGLLQKFNADSKAELIERAKVEGYLPND